MKFSIRILVLSVLLTAGLYMLIEFEVALPFSKRDSEAVVDFPIVAQSPQEIQARAMEMDKKLDEIVKKEKSDALEKSFADEDASRREEELRWKQERDEEKKRREANDAKQSAVEAPEEKFEPKPSVQSSSSAQPSSPQEELVPEEKTAKDETLDARPEAALPTATPSTAESPERKQTAVKSGEQKPGKADVGQVESRKPSASPSTPIAVADPPNPSLSAAHASPNVTGSSSKLSFYNSEWKQPAPPRKFDSVVFLKLHKVGSTTFSAFLENTANQNGLTICDFYPCGPRGDGKCLVDETLETIASKGYKKCDAWVSHGVEDAFRSGGMELIRKWFPNALTVVLLRDPVDRFLSRYYYDRVRDKTPVEKQGTITGYVMGKTSYEQHYLDSLGAHSGQIEVAKQNLEEFDVIGLTEEFDDAVTLAALYMGWNISNVRYLNQKVVVGRPKAEEHPPELIAKLRELLHSDIAIYEHAQSLQAVKRKPFPPTGYDQSLQVFRHFSKTISATDLRKGGDEGDGCDFKKVNFKFGGGKDCYKFEATVDDYLKKGGDNTNSTAIQT